MASPPVTFPCPFCGRRMGVPAELVGKQVRCPHCKQVVTAPVTAGTPPAAPAVIPVDAPPPPAPSPVVVVPEPPKAPEPELRAFNIPQNKEGADSILSDANESDDEVFGSHPGGRLPTLQPLDAPPPPPASEPASVPDDPFGFGPAVAPLRRNRSRNRSSPRPSSTCRRTRARTQCPRRRPPQRPDRPTRSPTLKRHPPRSPRYRWNCRDRSKRPLPRAQRPRAGTRSRSSTRHRNRRPSPCCSPCR